MTKELVTLYNPSAPPPALPEQPAAPRVDSLRGKFIGVLYNEKPNGDILLARLEKRLAEAFGTTGSIWRLKHPGARTTDQVLDELAEKCDFILNGIGD
ncbi:MAG: hypothetical protein HYX92_00605 [Chloroflexi bacterium]|nr:hypothetical protein [Chloroflexota bacterium]